MEKVERVIKVLVVEDSPTARAQLVHILESDSGIKVIGTADNGEAAIRFLKKKSPDVITMDINMPVMDGLEATTRIMRRNPLPIIIVSASWRPDEVEKTFSATEAGAVAIMEKPMGTSSPSYERCRRELTDTVRMMSEIKVVRRWRRKREPDAVVAAGDGEALPVIESADIRVVAMGASTGGPPVLRTILSSLPADFRLPVMIVQHITKGFVSGLAEWLGHSSSIPVSIAANGERIVAGHAYIAPDGFQMGVDKRNRIILDPDILIGGLCPSVSYLFGSVADIYGGSAAGVILTGMGMDGVTELKKMKKQGAVTIAQDRQSSVVFGMPGEAVRRGAARHVLTPEQIAKTLERF